MISEKITFEIIFPGGNKHRTYARESSMILFLLKMSGEERDKVFLSLSRYPLRRTNSKNKRKEEKSFKLYRTGRRREERRKINGVFFLIY